MPDVSDREQIIAERDRTFGEKAAQEPHQVLTDRSEAIAFFVQALEDKGLARNEAVLIAAYQFPF